MGSHSNTITREKIVGILGGMGPAATIDFMSRVLRNTPAEDDEDHIQMFINHNPKVPSRIKALIDKTGESPAPVLQKMARNLESMGADFLAMPCNTSHYYLSEIQDVIKIPILNMIDLTVDAVISNAKNIRKVGILASTAVLNVNIYSEAFQNKNITVIKPQDEQQQKIMEVIKAVKRNDMGQNLTSTLNEVINDLIEKGVEAIVIGCTEISVVTGGIDISTQLYDASEILARKVVDMCQTK
ncbi:MAG: amino acid racemase [Candidatus Marinimicrobia bacterium]|nr:amino acid racemase [Candidatus Neomarinimicrobiota bacterium]